MTCATVVHAFHQTETDLPNPLSSDQLRQLARLGARVRLEELRHEIAAIRRLLAGGEGGDQLSSPFRRSRTRGRQSGRTRRGKLSAAGRARIAAAQRARWAKIKKAKGSGPEQARKSDQASKGARKAGKRRAMSAAARKAVSERMKKYWAAKRKTSKAA